LIPVNLLGLWLTVIGWLLFNPAVIIFYIPMLRPPLPGQAECGEIL
jgi:hypothetical protein